MRSGTRRAASVHPASLRLDTRVTTPPSRSRSDLVDLRHAVDGTARARAAAAPGRGRPDRRALALPPEARVAAAARPWASSRRLARRGARECHGAWRGRTRRVVAHPDRYRRRCARTPRGWPRRVPRYVSCGARDLLERLGCAYDRYITRGSEMTIALPPTIARFIDASNARDLEAAVDCFGEEAVVEDEGRTHRGIIEVRAWKQATEERFRYTIEPTGMEERDGHSLVRAILAGNFPGSPVELTYDFRLVDDAIESLRIHP